MEKRPERILSLYDRIPDYSQVRHLGTSEFINKIEELKEEFRECRASLFDNDDSDVDLLAAKTRKALNIDDQEKKESFLSISSCEIHRQFLMPQNLPVNSYRPYEITNSTKDVNCHSDFTPGASTPGSFLSKWSSTSEFFRKDFSPPSNIEKRITTRKTNNTNKVIKKGKVDEKSPKHFRANPVPSHVHKQLFHQIMLKNKKRSMRVKEQSKLKLLSQVKPFSFSRKNQKNLYLSKERSSSCEGLNNSKPYIGRKKSFIDHCMKTNNKLDEPLRLFTANPAPPRKMALLSAIRLKEQQEYRELKKKLRAEALLRTSTLPPSMAERTKREKNNNCRFDTIRKHAALRKERLLQAPKSPSSVEPWTDEEGFSDDSTTDTKPRKKEKKKYFTPYGISRYEGANIGVFESTSVDNNASRLRVKVAKAREESRMKREEEEVLRSLKAEEKRQKLRDEHSLAWKRACSYSSAQDIEMRRQLRMAASILERESYKKDMNSMLTRVKSAPLLLEAVQEKTFLPCKKHREEMEGMGPLSSKRPQSFRNKSASQSRLFWRDWGEKSETFALAEGTLTNSDNESANEFPLDALKGNYNPDAGKEGRKSEEKIGNYNDDKESSSDTESHESVEEIYDNLD